MTKFIVFSDLDGSFLNEKTYSFGSLKNYINNLNSNIEIIFVTSKTYDEVLKIKKKLNINYPFAVENGACIFFPLDYFKNSQVKYNFIKYKKHIGLKISNLKSDDIYNNFNYLKEKYRFLFYNELSEKKILKITNLNYKDIKLSKIRQFSNPIYWEDSLFKKQKFKKEIYSMKKRVSIFDGGRFLHILDNYDKGIAVKKILEIKKKIDTPFKTISIGDSENDIPMLELTDFACIIKSKRNIVLKNKNIFKSNLIAPEGWRESLDYCLKKEIENF